MVTSYLKLTEDTATTLSHIFSNSSADDACKKIEENIGYYNLIKNTINHYQMKALYIHRNWFQNIDNMIACTNKMTDRFAYYAKRK